MAAHFFTTPFLFYSFRARSRVVCVLLGVGRGASCVLIRVVTGLSNVSVGAAGGRDGGHPARPPSRPPRGGDTDGEGPPPPPFPPIFGRGMTSRLVYEGKGESCCPDHTRRKTGTTFGDLFLTSVFGHERWCEAKYFCGSKRATCIACTGPYYSPGWLPLQGM